MLVLAMASWAVSSDARSARPPLPTRSGVLWSTLPDWKLSMPAAAGNPFDVRATATFVHTAGEARHETPLFYLGDGTWAFRFTPTRTGTWTFTTASAHEALDGWHGRVVVAPNPDPSAHGFLTSSGTRFAVPVDERGTLEARLYHVYLHHALKNTLDDYPTDPARLTEQIDEVLDEAMAHGFDAVFVSMNHNWFAYGAQSSADHDSEDPSLTTFAILETLIERAHERGSSVHVWAWSDEERRETPIGLPGGINGEVDRRLQRYIAGRLGPLPGWTMSYGFDLEEWVTPAQLHAWRDYLNEQWGWPHLLMARESRPDLAAGELALWFDGPKLDVFSTDARPTDDFYTAAKEALETSVGPVVFERRFLHTRDGVWDMDATRRALWQFTLAGGAGAIWGVLWNDGPVYPAPEQLEAHGRFWRDRWSLALVPRGVDDDGVYVLYDPDGGRLIAYAESTAEVPLDLSWLTAASPAIALDTRSAYAEIELGVLGATRQTWTAPYVSDWVVAVGTF